LARELNAPGFDAPAVYTNSRDTAYKGFGGYQFSGNFAVEGSYFDLGKYSFSAPTAPPGVLDGSLRVRGYGVDAVGLLPLTERFSAFAKLGETYAQTRDSFSATGVNDHGNVDAWFVSLIFKMGRTPAPMMPVAAF